MQVKEFLKDEQLYYAENYINNPTVSIILPTYCRGSNGLLQRSIDSVLGQTFTDFELIIVDDGSIDGTRLLVESYLKKDNRILYIRNDRNSGLPSIRVNQGLLHSKGKYICYQFDDDRWTETGLETLVEGIKPHSSMALFYGTCEATDTKSKLKLNFCTDFDYWKILQYNYIANNSVIHHRSIIDKYGMYDCHLTMRRLCDWDLWQRWSTQVPFNHIDTVVSLVDVMVDDSLGATVYLDRDAFRMSSGRRRNHLLTPDKIGEYEFDDLSFISDNEMKIKFYNVNILPWKLRHNRFPIDQNVYQPFKSHKQRILCIKPYFDASVSIMIENFIELCHQDYIFIYIPDQHLLYNDIKDGDILILHRATTITTLSIIEQLHEEKRNVSISYFIDDDLLNLYKLDEEFANLAPGSPIYENIKNMISLSDSVVTATKSIADAIQEYNPVAKVLPTNILSRFLKNKDAYYEDKIFKIIYMGSDSRKIELNKILNDLIKISKKYGHKVSFTFLGYIPPELKEIKTSPIEYIEFTSSYYQYLNQLKDSHYNLIISPLDDNEFKKSKSPIKVLESCCVGAVGLYSQVNVYNDIIDGVNGYKIQEGESWFEKIDWIISQPEASKREIFNHCLEYVKQNWTTEVLLPTFDLTLQTIKFDSCIKKDWIIFNCQSSQWNEAEVQLCQHCLMVKKTGLNLILVISPNISSQLKEFIKSYNIQTIQYECTNYDDLSDVNINQSIEEGKNFLNCIGAYSVAMIHSCYFMPSMGYVAKILNIPYVANLYSTNNLAHVDNIENIYAPDCIISNTVFYANLWQNKFNRVSRCIRNQMDIQEENIQLVPPYKFKIAVLVTNKTQLNKVMQAIGIMKSTLLCQLYCILSTGDDKNKYMDYVVDNDVRDIVFFEESTYLQHKLAELDINIFLHAEQDGFFPTSILDAISLGIPVVSIPVDGISEIIINQKSGYVSKDDTCQSLVDSIMECISSYHNETIVSIVNNAKDIIKLECSEEFTTKNLFDIYMLGLNKFKFKSYQDLNKKTSLVSSIFSRSIEPENLAFSGIIKKKRQYEIHCAIDCLSKIGIIFAMHGLLSDGMVKISLHANGRKLREMDLNIKSINFENWTYFNFETIHNSKGQKFMLVLTFFTIPCIGVYEDNRNRSYIYKVKNKLQIPFTRQNTLYIDCIK